MAKVLSLTKSVNQKERNKMSKKIYYDEEARERILGGAKALYDAVKVTFGPILNIFKDNILNLCFFVSSSIFKSSHIFLKLFLNIDITS